MDFSPEAMADIEDSLVNEDNAFAVLELIHEKLQLDDACVALLGKDVAARVRVCVEKRRGHVARNPWLAWAPDQATK